MRDCSHENVQTPFLLVSCSHGREAQPQGESSNVDIYARPQKLTGILLPTHLDSLHGSWCTLRDGRKLSFSSNGKIGADGDEQ